MQLRAVSLVAAAAFPGRRVTVGSIEAAYGRCWTGGTPPLSLSLPRSVPGPRDGAAGCLLCLYIRNK